MVQDRLWITDPKRATCLATVEETRGNRFRVDKALFAPRSNRCRHPQNHDQGTVWVEGEKRRLAGVFDEGEVWYTLRGVVPEVGASLQCELDRATRDQASRAHTAMHLWLAGLPADAAPMVASPEVRGGGHFRLVHAWPIAPEVLARTLQTVRQSIARDVPVSHAYLERGIAQHNILQQRFQPPDPFPGPDPVPVVTIEGEALPCDGSHVDRTGRISDVVVSHAAQGKDGFVIGCRVR